MDNTLGVVEQLIKNCNESQKSFKTITNIVGELHTYIKECDQHIKLLELKQDVDKITNSKQIKTMQNKIKMMYSVVFLQLFIFSFIFIWNRYS